MDIITLSQKKMLKELIGKPFEAITLLDLDNLSPGINRELYEQAAEMVVGHLLS